MVDTMSKSMFGPSYLHFGVLASVGYFLANTLILLIDQL